MLYFVFNVLRLLFISFGSMFQDLPSLTHTKNSLHFHSSFSLLLFYIHMSIAFHIILSQIHLEKNDVIYLQPFNDTYITLTLQYHLIVIHMSRLWPRKETCVFYSMTVAYSFDVEFRHCKFCEGYDSLEVFGCLRFWFGKVINVFYFRTKEKEKETFKLIIYEVIYFFFFLNLC